MFYNRSFQEAALKVLGDSEEWDCLDGCSVEHLSSLAEDIGLDETVDLHDEIVALISSGRAFVAVPLALLDEATVVMPVTWQVGASSPGDIEREFGPPHDSFLTEDGRTYVYDLYVEEVEDGYPQPPAPYEIRNRESGDELVDCNFPVVGIWPPEALQAKFVFDETGVLRSFDFSVGARVT